MSNRIELHRSRLLTCFVVAGHIAALASVFLLPRIGWSEKCGLLVLLAFSAGLPWWRVPRINAVRLGEQGELHCFLSDDEPVPALLTPGSTVFEHLLVLRFQLGEHRRINSLVLCNDSMPDGEFRRLRVWLRWRASLKGGVPERA